MQDDQLVLRIAELLEWKPTAQDIAAAEAWHEMTGEPFFVRPPNYLTDLNLWNEIEDELMEDFEDYYLYCEKLSDTVGGVDTCLVHASARDKAIAYLKSQYAYPE